MNVEGTHINFVHLPEMTRKTEVWQVLTKSGDFLGSVKWFSRWRKYCFFPHMGCIFEETCMREISDFIASRTASHKQALRDAK